MKQRIVWDLCTSDCALRLINYVPGTRQPPHAHSRDSITLVLRGELRESSEGGEERAASLSVVAKPAGIEHENEFGPAGACTLQIELPPDHRHRWSISMPRKSIRWEHAGPSCRTLLEMLSLLDRDAPPNPKAADELVHRSVAALSFRLPAEGPPTSWLSEIRVALERESTPIAALARRMGVHPVYLARRFRARFGVSPTAYRTRLRVQRAARSLLETKGPLAALALDAGYYDQPHMNRQIRATTGLTPRALRSVSGWIDTPEARGFASARHGCVRTRTPR